MSTLTAQPPTPSPVQPLTTALPVPGPWARERLHRLAGGMPIPVYGSAAWRALPGDHPLKWAAALVAAEAHRYEAETLADRLRAELDAAADAELVEDIADGATEAMRREQALAERAGRIVQGTVNRLLARR